MPVALRRAWATVIAFLMLVLAAFPALALHPGDWPRFVAGGATVGTGALMNERLHLAFQQSHGLASGIWTYPPAFAWAFVPAAFVPVATGYICNFVATLILAGVAGWMLAGVFGFQRWFGVLAALAWEPAVYSGDVGQVSALWLALICAAVVAAASGNEMALGMAVGVLLLKPPLALPFVAVLLVRKHWAACGIIALIAVACYVVSVAAAGGDWRWIPAYASSLHSLHQTDLGALYNGISIPTILERIGVPELVAVALAGVLFLALLPALSRGDDIRALCFTSLFALAINPHAWMYDVAVALPALFYGMRCLEEPWRTRLVVSAYLLAATWMAFVSVLWFNPLALIVILGSCFCAVSLLKSQTARPRSVQST